MGYKGGTGVHHSTVVAEGGDDFVGAADECAERISHFVTGEVLAFDRTM